MSDSPDLVELSDAEILFLIKMGLRKIGTGTLNKMRGRADHALLANQMAAETILAHFKLARHRIFRGPGARDHGQRSPEMGARPSP